LCNTQGRNAGGSLFRNKEAEVELHSLFPKDSIHEDPSVRQVAKTKEASLMWLHEIWRYPVKSMAGESLACADLTQDGIAGDRIVQVRNAAGRVITARTRPALLGHRARLGPDSEPEVDGRPWRSGEVAADVETAAGRESRLVESSIEDRFDILPLLVVTDGMLAAVGYDRRRFRPNLVVAGVTGLSEREWEGGALKIGQAVIGIEDLRTRCIMTTYDPDTQKQDLAVLRRVQTEFGGQLGLNCYVVAPGQIKVGDPVEFVPS
jgi:MOSC domain-containing protein